ncbi:MAG: hypothetical protein AAF221_02770 [Pseudomonadota bacterium]
MGYSLKQKFHAWWEGYDLPPFEEAAASDSHSSSETEAAEGALSPKNDPNTINLDKLQFLQTLWGDGFVRPGTKAAALTNSKPLLLTDSTNVIEFGAGLGAYARAVAAANICYFDGFESDPLLVEASQGIKQSAEEAKFASVSLSELGRLPNSKNYHRAIFNRYLHRLEDPIAMLGEMKMQLKDENCAILLNEYTAGPGGLLPDNTQAMMDGFSAPRALISRDVYVTALEELGFEIRVNEDQSGEHLRDIAAAWSRMDQRLLDTENPLDLNAISSLISQETARWSAMSTALREGTMQYARILAIVK